MKAPIQRVSDFIVNGDAAHVGINDVHLSRGLTGSLIKKSFLIEKHRSRRLYQEIFGALAAKSAGVNVPEVIGWNDASDPPYVLIKHIEGATPLHGSEKASWESVGRMLARVHSIRFADRKTILASSPNTVPTPNCVDFFTPRGGAETQLSSILEREVGLEVLCDCLDELRAELIESLQYDPIEHYGLTHGDLGPHNILLGGDGKLYALDWEHAHFGDTRLELVCVKRNATAYFSASMVHSLLSGYADAGGNPEIDPGVELLGTFKWLIDRTSYWSMLLELARRGKSKDRLNKERTIPLSDWIRFKDTLDIFLEHDRYSKLRLVTQRNDIERSMMQLFAGQS